MEFSELHKHDAAAGVSVAPDGRMLAYVTNGVTLVIQDMESLETLQQYACLDTVDSVSWAPDSQYVACVLKARKSVEVWSVEHAEWKCKIESGAEGLECIRWSPDSRHILAWAEFRLRVTVWSLVDKSSVLIPFPKFERRGVAFSSDGRYMALAHRNVKESRDTVGVYSCGSWAVLKEFAVETLDLADLTWSPNGNVICVWDACTSYKLLTYSMDGTRADEYCAYDDALGVKSVSWSRSSLFLAVGSYDEHVRILNTLTWKLLADHAHPTCINSAEPALAAGAPGDTAPAHVYREPAHGAYHVEDGEVAVPHEPVKLGETNAKGEPKHGVCSAQWSCDGEFLATRNENMPETVWVWRTATLSLQAALIHTHKIRCAKWDPASCRLAMCTGTGRVYLWTKEVAMFVDVPSEDFTVTDLHWSADASSIVLCSSRRKGQAKGQAAKFIVLYVKPYGAAAAEAVEGGEGLEEDTHEGYEDYGGALGAEPEHGLEA